jgi:hypothetical protein
MQQPVKFFIFLTLNVLQSFISGRVGISFGVSSRVSGIRHDAGSPFF